MIESCPSIHVQQMVYPHTTWRLARASAVADGSALTDPRLDATMLSTWLKEANTNAGGRLLVTGETCSQIELLPITAQGADVATSTTWQIWGFDLQQNGAGLDLQSAAPLTVGGSDLVLGPAINLCRNLGTPAQTITIAISTSDTMKLRFVAPYPGQQAILPLVDMTGGTTYDCGAPTRIALHGLSAVVAYCTAAATNKKAALLMRFVP